MRSTRRTFLGTSILLSVTAGAGCLESLGLSNSVRVSFSGNVHADEPLVEGVHGLGDGYPHHYVRLVTSKGQEETEVRWDYIDDELPLLTGSLEGTDFDSEFLLFFGVVLPRNRSLQPDTATRIEDGTLYTDYRIEESGSASSEIAINTAIKRVVHDERPDDAHIGLHLTPSS